jgi:oligopeptide/dipeptide ABC transporter ATP-binding protein
MPSPDEAVLDARDLHKTFTTGRAGLGRTKVSAVDGVSLRLRAGESLGIVGESGCGKSTLARMLVGLERPDSGTIRVHGRDASRARGRDRRLLRRQVQMVFQDPYTSLDPRMSVRDLIAEPLIVHRQGGRRARQDRVAELLGLLSASPVVDRTRRGRPAGRIVLAGDPPSPSDPPSGCRFHTRCRLAQDRCAKEQPVLTRTEVGPDREVACHFAEQALAEAALVASPRA